MKVGYSIVNLYEDGSDSTEWHRDNYSAGGMRMEALGGASGESPDKDVPHNATIGASFGGERELRFKHLESGAEFGFPQKNGDIFAFTDVVNTRFQHAILPASLPRGSSSRISIIWWGHCPSLSARIHQVSAATPAGAS